MNFRERLLLLMVMITAVVLFMTPITSSQGLTPGEEPEESLGAAATESVKSETLRAVQTDLVQAVPKTEKQITVVAKKTSTKTYASSGGTKRWAALVRKWFKTDHGTSDALYVMSRESGGNPNSVNRIGCTGLFQIHPCHLTKFRQVTGTSNMKDPEANIRFAAYMTQRGTNWSSWSVKPPGH